MTSLPSAQPGVLSPELVKTASDEDRVESTSVLYDRMAARWDLIHDLLGGTDVMRAARTRWLPLEPNEKQQSYNLRISRSFLYNTYRDTLDKLSGKPFSRPVTLQGELPAELKGFEDDVDRSGTDLTQFAREILKQGINYGLTHILVDFPEMELAIVEEGAEPLTMADERDAGARALFVHVTPPNLIGWRSQRVAGQEVLTQIRIKESRILDRGLYGDEEVDFIRVYNASTWELWKKKPKDEGFDQVEEGAHTFGGIPLVTFYVNRTGFLTGVPALEDLAWLNLAHWQSLSDQRNILRFSRVGILFGAGFSDEEIEEDVTVGANRMLRSTNPNATLKYVEHTGKAIGAGEEDLNKLEERMEVLGMAPFVQRTGNQTATGKAMDEARTQSLIQAWIRNEEKALEQCYSFVRRWSGGDGLSDDFSVDIFNEFGLSLRASEDIVSLIEMRKNGEISRETFLTEIKRRGVLSDTVEVDAEMEKIEREAPRLGALMPPGDDDEDEDEDEDEDNEE